MAEHRKKLKKIVSGETQNHFEKSGKCVPWTVLVLSSTSFLVIYLLSRCDLTIQVYEGHEERTTSSPVDLLI